MNFAPPKTVIEFSGWYQVQGTSPDDEPYYTASIVAHDILPAPNSSARVAVTVTQSDIERNPEPEILQDLIRNKIGCALLSLADVITSTNPRSVPA